MIRPDKIQVGDLVLANSPVVHEIFVVTGISEDDMGWWVSGDTKGYGVRQKYIMAIFA